MKIRTRTRNPIRFLVMKLCLVAVVMLGFALFLMPPLYDVFCDITGLNGKTNSTAYSLSNSHRALLSNNPTEAAREITVQFITNHNHSMPWEFEPMQSSIKASIGRSYHVRFWVKNTTHRTMKAQAIPSVSPSSAAEFLKKIECFCFQQQTLQAGESAELPLTFTMKGELPKDVSKVTLSYTLFDITNT